MLDLQAGVHLEERELAGVGVNQAFNGASAQVPDGLSGPDRRFEHALAKSRRNTRGRGFLCDLLMAALYRAVAFAKRKDRPVREPEDLHLDVPRPRRVTLDQDGGVAEEALCAAARGAERGTQLLPRRARRSSRCRRRLRPP